MTEMDADGPSTAPVVTVFELGGVSYLATTEGLALYLYWPTLAAAKPGHEGPWIPWIENWPPHTPPTEQALLYHPLPRATADPSVPEKVKKELGEQLRGEGQQRDSSDTSEDALQATYNDWPLYIYKNDVPAHPPQPKGIVTGIFQLVPVDLAFLPIPPQPGVPYPPGISGP